jgi:glycosyltransferase involved in cell wall biosynthesis
MTTCSEQAQDQGKYMSFRTPPVISVVVTNYNYARWVQGAVESAHMADEIIVVDDGSTDGSQDLIKAISGITPVLKSNGGHASAINAGFAASRGDVVIFLDADDRLGEKCIPAIKSNWTPDVSKLQWGLLRVDENDKPRDGILYPTFTHRHTPQWCREQMRIQCFYDAPPTSGNAWSRSFLERVMPLPQLGSSMWALDDYMHLLAPHFGDVVSLTEVYGCYRVHATQMSASGQFNVERIERITSDEVLRYEVVSDFLVRHGHNPLDALRWSDHTLKRIFLRRLGRSRESIWPLIPRYIAAAARRDRGLNSKAKHILLGLALVIPYPPLVLWLAKEKYTFR